MAAQFEGKMFMTQGIPSSLELTGVVARQRFYESDKLFYQDNSPAFISHLDGFARLDYAWALGRSGKARAGVGYGTSRNSFYTSDGAEFLDSNREHTHMNLGQAVISAEYCTLDNMSFPSSGAFVNLTAMQTLGKYYHRHRDGTGGQPMFSNNQHWFQAEARASRYYGVGKNFSIGGSIDLLVSNRRLLDTYYATLVNAPSYTPCVSMEDVFNKAFHAHSFAAIGITPIWRPFQRAQVRLTGSVFMPFRKIEQASDGIGAMYGRWFADPEFTAELDLVYNLPFASICGYVNYLSYPARNWNVGLSFGLYFTAARFLR